MNKKWMAVVALLVLMLSVCVLAAAEEPTDPAGSPEEHEHTVSVQIISISQSGHWLHKWCPDCGALLGEVIEDHTYADGVCTVCEWKCTHPTGAAVICYERDRSVKPRWDGNYVIGPGWEITECGACHTVVSRVETTVYESHSEHTRFLPEQECMPHDAVTHALVRICEDCGTEVPEFVPHNCPPSDRPYKDEGDPDTHSRLVRCADCGFWVPQQQAHTWVHDSYRKNDTDGSEEGHIEVMKCSVCGAKKTVWRPHGAITPVAYRQNGNADTHIVVLRCTLCNETFEAERLHEMEHASCRNDGDTATHIEVLKCTLCEAEAERREVHKPVHISWKSISDTQDQETVRCNMCGLTYTNAPAAHTFDTYAYESEGTGSWFHTKYVACSKCGTRKSTGEREGHIWYRGGDPWGDYCTKCNEAGWHKHYTRGGSTVSGFRAVDENNHAELWLCRDCHTHFEGRYFAHSFDPATMKCTVCGYLKEGCEHSNTYKPVDSGITAEQHTVIGTCTKCGKQITLTGAHDMQFVSRSGYEPCENGHTYIDTYRCSYCGYETEKEISEEHTIRSVAEYIDDKTHMEKCELCSYTGPAAHSLVKSTNPGECSRCKYCGFDADHEYYIAHIWLDGLWSYHTLVYQCRGCGLQIEKRQDHMWEIRRQSQNETVHTERTECSICGWGSSVFRNHEFDESGVCVCGYRRRDQADGVLWPQAGQTEDPGNVTTVTPVFCHLTADGKEMTFGHKLIPLDETVSENGKAFSFIILPEGISGDPVIEARFTARELALLQAFGVKSVYICPGENDILLLDDVSQALTALTGQEIDELVITLTPGSDGVYTVQYDPAGVYITE